MTIESFTEFALTMSLCAINALVLQHSHHNPTVFFLALGRVVWRYLLTWCPWRREPARWSSEFRPSVPGSRLRFVPAPGLELVSVHEIYSFTLPRLGGAAIAKARQSWGHEN